MIDLNTINNYPPAVKRCIRAGQWQNAANMTGISEHEIRSTHDATYMRRDDVEAAKPAPVVHGPDEFAVWVNDVRATIRAAGIEYQQFAAQVGLAGATVSNALRRDVPLSAFVKTRIDNGIEALKLGAPIPTHEPRYGSPVDERWLAKTLGRMSRLKMSVSALACMIKHPKSSVLVSLKPGGKITRELRDKIELALKCCEAPFHVERAARQVEGRAA